MTKMIKRVVVTGGAGQIAYSLLFRIASGEMLGGDQPVALHILEMPDALKALEGTAMELEDCAYPLLKEIHIGSNPFQIFEQADVVILVGAKPRGPGMERKDLLSENGRIFVEQGKALNDVASENVKVLVVGNPCNTNCLIAMHHAPRLSKRNFHAMTRLDQNRAVSFLAHKAKVAVNAVSQMTIWGNHSATQVPDFVHTRINQKPLSQVITDQHWLENDFMSLIQKRGAAIIEARGKSSAASAANAIIDAMKSLNHPTPKGEWFSSGVCTDDNAYGIEKNLIFSVPCRVNAAGEWEMVEGLSWNEFLKHKIKATEKELIEERAMVEHFISAHHNT